MLHISVAKISLAKASAERMSTAKVSTERMFIVKASTERMFTVKVSSMEARLAKGCFAEKTSNMARLFSRPCAPKLKKSGRAMREHKKHRKSRSPRRRNSKFKKQNHGAKTESQPSGAKSKRRKNRTVRNMHFRKSDRIKQRKHKILKNQRKAVKRDLQYLYNSKSCSHK